MRKNLVVAAVVAAALVWTAAFVARDQSARAIPARELLAEPDYFHGRVLTVDTSKGWEQGEGRTLVFRHKIPGPPVIVAHVPTGQPDAPKTVRGVFMRGDDARPHTIHPVP